MKPEAHRIMLDPAEGDPPELPSAPESGLVLAYVPDAEAEACGRHLVEFAHRWRDEGHRVVLADARVASPVLHATAGVENGEGVTDVILHGTSLARATVEIDDGVELVTAGTIAPDPDRVLAHPRWTTLVSGFHETGGLLVVTVPDAVEAGRLEELASVVVRFRSADAEGVPLESGAPLTDALDAAGSAGPSDSTAAPEDDPAAAAASPDEPAEPAGSGAPGRKPRQRVLQKNHPATGSGGRGGRLLVVLLLVVLVVLGAAFMGWIEIPGVTPSDIDVTVGYLPHP
jgi:hypothetical protein